MKPPIFCSGKTRAQAMVEFMLVLPFLLLLLYGIIELGRLAFIFSSASNASREAARYGAASGENERGVPHYRDCDGIREIVNKSAYISDFDKINITYDRGVNPDGTQIPISGIDPSPSQDSCPLEDNSVRNGDRIIVQVSTSYEPIISIVPIDPLEIVSSSARTFLVSIPILGSAFPTGFSAETSTPSRVPTERIDTGTPMVTALFTSTKSPPNYTPRASSPTNAFLSTLTFTPSRTPLPTSTPTITPTYISCTGVTGVGHGPLLVKDNLMQMTISNNTGHLLATAQVYVEWNNDTGHHEGNAHSLHLRQVTLNDQIWNGDISAPSQYIEGFYPSIPIGGSVVRFVFDQNYDTTDGTERIIVTLGTPGCINYPIDSSH